MSKPYCDVKDCALEMTHNHLDANHLRLTDDSVRAKPVTRQQIQEAAIKYFDTHGLSGAFCSKTLTEFLIKELGL